MKTKSIVERIVALLQLTDSGKIQHFFDKQIKSLNRDIVALERNITTLTFHHEADLDAAKEKLEDAKVELESAYLNVTIENVDTNAKQDSYSNAYWNGVELAEEKVQTLEARIISKTDAFKDQVKDIEIQIAERKRRVDKIS
jgi:predicted  nucleic acid-binding Zn-ribbon protein